MSLKVARKLNPAWKRYMAEREITTVAAPVVSRAQKFFLMGSCFAEEIRLALEQALGAGHVVPDYRQLAFDKTVVQVDELPERNHLNTYNAYSVLQEIERILQLWSPAADDYWQLEGRVQCPYRRLVFAQTPQAFADVTAGLDAVLRQGFAEADHFVFTFGMTEVFINRVSGKVANQKPGYGHGGGREEADYHRAGFAENLAVMERLVDLITAQKPEAKIFVTVSPVPLKRTFSGEDIFVANMLSKSTLRAALGQLAENRSNVVYFPSYEAVISAGADAWEADGRHVRRALVEEITSAFVGGVFHR
jgi:hypothetical protein